MRKLQLPHISKEKVTPQEILILEKFSIQKVNWKIVQEKGYCYFKIPVYEGHVQGNKKKQEMIKLCLEKLYELYCNLKNRYQYNKNYVSTMILIQMPNFWESQVIIFFHEIKYRNWFHRNFNHMQWIPCFKKNKLLQTYHLSQYALLKEKHYTQKIVDNTFDPPYKARGDLWFYEKKFSSSK